MARLDSENPDAMYDSPKLDRAVVRRWQLPFALDLRSLAAMRIALGLLILIDLGTRIPVMEAMYTDAGFFSVSDRAAYVDSLDGTAEPISWSIHAWSGSMGWQVFLFALTAIGAFMMMVGWHTRIACIVTWVLLASMHMRNSLILHSGDCLLRLATFWCMFLPVGALWSFDARRRADRHPSPFFSGATLGLVLTLFSLYFFAGIAKWNEVWFSGDAMEYVLRLDIYVTELGKSMLGQTAVLKGITWATLVVEIVLPLLMLVPWKNNLWRWIALVTFCGLHIGIAVTMQIGLFAYVALAVWLSLIPSEAWDRWNVLRRRAGSLAKWPSSFGYRLTHWAGVFFAIYFLAWNVANVRSVPALRHAMPQQARVIGKWLNMRQSFHMFDVPPKHSPWFVYEAELNNGTRIDFFRNAPVDHSRPDSVLATIPSHHWRRLHRNLARPVFARFRKPVSQYLVRRWNHSHDEDSQIATARTTVYLDEITPDSETEGLVTQVWHVHGEDVAQKKMFEELLKKMKDKGIILP